MKTQYRYLIATVVGVGLALLLPYNAEISRIAESIAQLTLRLGQYFLLPLIFCSLPVAVTQLRRLGALKKLMTNSTLYVIATTAILTLIGTLTAWIFDFGRIPITLEQAPELAPINFIHLLTGILTFKNITSHEGFFVLSLVFPAFILGWHFFFDKEIAEPSYNFFDSLSRILYRANFFLMRLMPAFLVIFAFNVTYTMRNIVDLVNFLPLLLFLFGITMVLIAGVYPLIIRLACKFELPMQAWNATSGALFSVFISASPLFNYGNLTMHLKENAKIPRSVAALTAPLYMMFARAGTALVSAVCMITIVRSYSSLEVTLFQVAWIAFFSFVLSFTIPTLPGRGVVIVLMLLGNLYGRGLDEGWFILVPIVPFLIMISVVLDTATAILFFILTKKNVAVD